MTQRPGGDRQFRVYWVNQFAVPPDQPGGTRHFDMARELRALGVDAHLVASDLNLTTRTYSRRSSGRSVISIHDDVEGVPFTFLSAGSYSGNDWRRVASMLVFSLLVFTHLLRVPRGRRTVVIGSSPHLFAALAAWMVARFRRLSFVLEVRDLWPESYIEMTGRTSGVQVALMRVIADLLYRRSDAVVVLAPANLDHVVGRGAVRDAVVVIPNGVDLRHFDAAVSPAVELGRDGVFTFVYAGAHGPANGLDVVLDACDRLRDRGVEGLRVALVGDGPSKADLRRRADELELTNVTFHDPVAKDNVPSMLRTADAGLMVLAPKDLFSSGVSPNKLFDYLAADLPVLTNVPGYVASIVEEAGAGLAAAPGDPEALADAMIALRERCQTGGGFEPGRPYVAAHFERTELAKRLASLLTAVTSPGEQAPKVRVRRGL